MYLQGKGKGVWIQGDATLVVYCWFIVFDSNSATFTQNLAVQIKLNVTDHQASMILLMNVGPGLILCSCVIHIVYLGPLFRQPRWGSNAPSFPSQYPMHLFMGY